MATTTLIGIKPSKKQKEIIDGIRGECKYHIVSIGRQSGKSILAMNLVLMWGLNNDNTKILWVSPVYSQTTKVQKELFKNIMDAGIVDSCNYSDNIITFKNGSEIMFRSSERYDNIRGYTIDYAIIDEAAYVKEEAWTEAIKPTLLVRGKKVLFLSTPKGKNWFYKMYQMGLSEDYPEYKSYRGSSFDNPFVNKNDIMESKKTLPDNVFKQEYMGEFIDDGGEVFGNIKNCTFNEYPTPNGQIYCGIDLGRQNDYSVATFMDKDGRVIDIYRDNKREWSGIVDTMVMMIKKYKAITTIEVNSMGDVIYEQLSRRVKNIHPFVTTNNSKQEIIEGLILDFNEGNIQIPTPHLFEPLYNELSSFTFEYSPSTRRIKYGAPQGLHDDCVISLALCNYTRKTKSKVGSYTWIK